MLIRKYDPYSVHYSGDLDIEVLVCIGFVLWWESFLKTLMIPWTVELQNMFLAIINDTYSEVKIEIANQRNEFEIADYFKRGYNNMMGKLGRRDKIVDIQNALKLSDANGDGMLTFDEIRTNLKKYVMPVF